MSERGLVDVHAHFTTPHYIEVAKAAGQRAPDGMPEAYWPQWSVEEHLAVMDELGIRLSVLSLSSPGVTLPGVDAADLAAEVNDVAAAAHRARPDRFGFFASLPMLDESAARAEIHRSFDELGASGAVVLSNTGGAYLGDPRLEPVLAELDRRHAVLFVHPTSPPGVDAVDIGRPAPMAEFLFDTARTVLDFALRGAAARFGNLRVIIPHMGGAIPVLAGRAEAFRGIVEEPTGSVTEFLARAWWDLAGFPSPSQTAALTGLVDPGSLLYGSDWNWTRADLVGTLQNQLDEQLGRYLDDWRATVGANAERLLGRT